MHPFNSNKLEKNSGSIDIEDISNEILKHIYLRIKDEHKLNKNELLIELPYYYERLTLIHNSDEFDIKQVRLIIWGKVIESLNNNNFMTKINIETKTEKCTLYIKWASSFDKYKKDLDKYKNLIMQNMV
jgi:hypothetical protein